MKPAMWLVCLNCAWLGVCCAPALGWDLPGWSRDSRVREVLYRPDAVVRIDAQRGFATHIVLDAKEHIEVVAPGDRDGWQVLAKRGDHDVYLKPQLAAHDTNLEIRTDRRSYSFDLVVLPLAARLGNRQEMYRVTFTYPADQDGEGGEGDGTEARQRQDAAAVQARLDAPPLIRNTAYSMQVMPHSDDITPGTAWDDGRFTYIRIPDNRRIPAVFRVAEDGSESVVDRHMQGDLIVVHEVGRRFVLRLSDEVVGLWNDAYDVNGVPPVGGTTVDGVKRVPRQTGEHGDD
ncbi:TrbG/VirB9 family P-type conjugative transfer protein [Paraburkholderia sp. BCC1885]|uniref:TrbG/VirB9 family P-type conjugative transfer protein n=1 Tax=Paraburkholderia sp. BCC1885 TaxID=2562669 RepID=UPI001182995C|nr:TrbG/VirB9 family P-type conjugative transfer protein [Paraburkholderia sp. BCC1885]